MIKIHFLIMILSPALLLLSTWNIRTLWTLMFLSAPKKCNPHQNFAPPRKPNFMRGEPKIFFWPCASSVPCWTRFQNDPNLGLYLRAHMLLFMVIYTLNSLKMGSKPNYQEWTLGRQLEDKESLDTLLMHQSWWNLHQTF